MGGDPSQPQMSTFMRGLVVGAFVGAAVAGSTIWRRRRDQAAKLRAASISANLNRPAAPAAAPAASVAGADDVVGREDESTPAGAVPVTLDEPPPGQP